MSKRQVKMVIICEDTQHEVFIRRLLKEFGFNNRKIRVLKSPSGKGSGEQYVCNQYPVEVRELRKRNQIYHGLLVGIDADKKSVDECRRQLDQTLRDATLDPRQPVEPFVLLIPRRNIETWIHWLLGNDVDEDQEVEEDRQPYRNFYKGKRVHEKDHCVPAVKRFIELVRDENLPDSCPQSLQIGVEECNRLSK